MKLATLAAAAALVGLYYLRRRKRRTAASGGTRICIGTLDLATDHFAFLDAAFALGVRTFDLAFSYGEDAERNFGKWLKLRQIRREDVVIICKGGEPSEEAPTTGRLSLADLMHDLTASLARIGIEYADHFLLHRDDDRVDVGRVVEAMNALLERGLCKRIGTSNWSVERLRAANHFAARHGLVGFSCEEVLLSPFRLMKALYTSEYNPHRFYTVPEDEDDSTNEYIDWAREQQQPHTVVAYSPAWRPAYTEAAQTALLFNRIVLAWLRAIARHNGCPMAHVHYAWLHSHPLRPIVCAGTRNVAHLREAIAFVNGRATTPVQGVGVLHASPPHAAERFLRRGVSEIHSLSDVSPSELRQLADEAVAFVQSYGLNGEYGALQNWHAYHPTVHKILHDSGLRAVVGELLGECVCYATELFMQFPRNVFEFTRNWHTDDYAFAGTDAPHFTLQVALTPTTADNCLAFIPYSHLNADQYTRAPGGDKKNVILYDVPDAVAAARQHPLVCATGEFVLSYNGVIHASCFQPGCESTRVCLTLRLTHPKNRRSLTKWQSDSPLKGQWESDMTAFNTVGPLVTVADRPDALLEQLWAAADRERQALAG